MVGLLIKNELYKLGRCRLFYISLGISLAIGLCAAAASIELFDQQFHAAIGQLDFYYTMPFSWSPFTQWLPVTRVAFWTSVYVFTAPLLVVLGYSWTLRTELSDGYAAQWFVRTNYPGYVAAKAFAAFVAGGLIAAAPLIVNFIALACFIPLYQPSIVDVIGFGVYERVPLSGVFYRNPFLFVALRLAINFALGGAWGALVMMASLFVRNRVVLVVGSYCAVVALKLVSEQVYPVVYGLTGMRGEAVSLIDLLRVSGDSYNYTVGTLCLCFVAMVAAAVIIFVASMRRGRL